MARAHSSLKRRTICDGDGEGQSAGKTAAAFRASIVHWQRIEMAAKCCGRRTRENLGSNQVGRLVQRAATGAGRAAWTVMGSWRGGVRRVALVRASSSHDCNVCVRTRQKVVCAQRDSRHPNEAMERRVPGTPGHSCLATAEAVQLNSPGWRRGSSKPKCL